MNFSLRVSPRREAFTLIELLVGMSVGILLVVILFQIFNVAATAWQRGENQADAYREARAAMQLMTRDLSSVAVQFPVNPAASPAPSPTDGGIAPNLVLDKYPAPDPARQSGDENNEEVYCLTTVPNSGLSSLCAVGYFCQWLPDVTSTANGDRAPRSYSLFRQFLGSGGGSNKQAGLFELLKAAPKGPLDFMSVFVRSRPNATAATTTPAAGSITATPTEMASYIWDLQFRIDTNLKSPRGNTPAAGGQTPAQPPNDHGDLQTPPAPVRQYAAAAGVAHPTELPSYIEIRFKALSAGGARQLEGNTSVTRDTWWQANSPLYNKVILPSTQQFVARVPLLTGRQGVTP